VSCRVVSCVCVSVVSCRTADVKEEEGHAVEGLLVSDLEESVEERVEGEEEPLGQKVGDGRLLLGLLPHRRVYVRQLQLGKGPAPTGHREHRHGAQHARDRVRVDLEQLQSKLLNTHTTHTYTHTTAHTTGTRTYSVGDDVGDDGQRGADEVHEIGPSCGARGGRQLEAAPADQIHQLVHNRRGHPLELAQHTRFCVCVCECVCAYVRVRS
jgi:hypothetical protein